MESVRINKSTSLSAAALDEATLEKINRFTLEALTAEQVFTFKATLCDTRIDRDGERFTAAALGRLKELFVGRTTIKDHMMSAENQIARIYDTELVRSGDETELIAYCYMVRTSGNADLIAEIAGGIKKEGSVSCAVSQRVCSICGKNNLQTPCRHIAGKEYNGEICCKLLDGVEDAYEFSLVAVPAQRSAGIHKDADLPEEKSEDSLNETQAVQALLFFAKAAAYRAKYNIEQEETK